MDVDAFWLHFPRPGASWEASVAVLGASWGVLGASWGRLGASWARLGRPKNINFPWFFQCFCGPRPHWRYLASTSVLNASWEHLASVLGASWGVLGASWRPKGSRNGGQESPKWSRRGDANRKRDFFKNHCFQKVIMIFEVLRLLLGAKIAAKSDLGALGSMFEPS